jgi:RHS repeat-associated protein
MPFAVMRPDGLYYMVYDQVGSLKLIAGSAGNVVKSIEYDTFGNIISDSNPGFAVPFGFAGGLHDRDTGLVRFGYRDYDPETGRWTAKDPIRFAGGDTDLYGYCLGDPVNFVDPEGKFATILGGFIGGAVAGGIAGGITSAAASYLSGDSLSGVLKSGLIGAGIGAGIGGIAGASIGAGLFGGLGFASDIGWGFAAGAGIGEHAALSSLLGAALGGAASIFTDPGVCSNEKGPEPPDPFDIYGYYGTGAGHVP